MSGSDVSANRVAAILKAAEDAADRIRAEAESRMQARIAEGDRAATNRVRAAEEEAAEILAQARAEAERIQAEATSHAADAVGRAQDQSAKALADARRHSAELLAEARTAARDVKTEGTELVGHLRELSDSLRGNAGRLMRDVLDAHAALAAELDRVDGGASARTAGLDRPARASSERRRAPVDGDFDVPEFLPDRG